MFLFVEREREDNVRAHHARRRRRRRRRRLLLVAPQPVPTSRRSTNL
jgi:hypothetical protein